MLQELEMQSLQDLLHETARGHHDHTVSADDLHVDEITGTLHVRSLSKDYDFKPLALSQIATKLKIPATYLQRCPNSLRARNINHWLSKQNSEVLVRCDGDQVRAILSGRYNPVSNTDIASWLIQRFDRDTNIRFEITDSHMNVNILDPKDYLVSPGDALNKGISVRNSEVGLARVEVSGFIYRQVCLNGMIMAEPSQRWSKRHIGNGSISTETQSAIERLKDAPNTAIEGFTALHGVHVADMPGLFERVAGRYTFTDAQSTAVTEAFKVEPGETLYHAVNAVTRGANSESLSLEHRHYLQECGGQMLEASSRGDFWLT